MNFAKIGKRLSNLTPGLGTFFKPIKIYSINDVFEDDLIFDFVNFFVFLLYL